jgi:NADPH-dependent 2,4-dienoyl-CoA reductase/sulfur reductase-like enzyme
MPAIFSKVEGVLPLRTMDDAIAIRERIASRPRVLILGGGLIGCELAASMRGLGLDVAIVEQLDTLLTRPFGGALSDYFLDLHRRNGVEVLTGVTVARLVERKGTVAQAHLSDGTVLETELVLIGAGSQPATRWLEGSGVVLSDGVVCDEYLATSAPGIFAAGDVARWLNPCFGTRMRVEHWTNASAQGRAAARNLAAGLTGRTELAKPFGDVPYFWSDQYGQKIQMVGWHEGYDRIETEDPEGAPGPIVRFYRDGSFVAAAGVNAPRAVMGYRRQIELEARAQPAGFAAAS